MGLLDDPQPDVRHAAAMALARLGANGAAPKLVEMLVDEDPWAAAALCLLGRREGVPVVLAAAESHVRLRGDLLHLSGDAPQRPSCLVVLNALRSPGLRSRLEAKPLSAPVSTGVGDVAKAVAAEAGLELKDEASGQEASYYGYRPFRRGSLWQVLVAASTSTERSLSDPDEREVILEEGKVRLLNVDEAVRFWKSWAGK